MHHSQASNLAFIDKFGGPVIPVGDILHVSLVPFFEEKQTGRVAVVSVGKESLGLCF